MPQVSEYRPIIVMSPLIKFLEGRLVGKLRHYGRRKLHYTQFGFVSKLGIEECKEQLLQEIGHRQSNNQDTTLLFIDLRAAYDRVDLR